MRMRHIVICGLPPLYNIFHYLRNGTIFGKKGYLTKNVCFQFLYDVCLKLPLSQQFRRWLIPRCCQLYAAKGKLRKTKAA